MDVNEDELKKRLSSEEYQVLREKATEPPFSGKYLTHSESGVYTCKVCGTELFTSENKLDSSQGDPGLSGWPSFSDPVVAEKIGMREDNEYGMHRTEIYCKTCGSHLGHFFKDNYAGKNQNHYCVNSVCLDFKPM